MRWLVVAMIVGAGTGCSARAEQGPAWPKAAVRETDGGESLAPRQPKSSALEADADDADGDAKPVVATPAVTVVVVAPAGVTSAATTPMATSPEEAIMTEEIVIEVDD